MINLSAGIKIGGIPIVGGHHFQVQDDHAVTDGSPSENLIFSTITVLSKAGPQSFREDYSVI
jgi:hypothetical protein